MDKAGYTEFVLVTCFVLGKMDKGSMFSIVVQLFGGGGKKKKEKEKECLRLLLTCLVVENGSKLVGIEFGGYLLVVITYG